MSDLNLFQANSHNALPQTDRFRRLLACADDFQDGGAEEHLLHYHAVRNRMVPSANEAAMNLFVQGYLGLYLINPDNANAITPAMREVLADPGFARTLQGATQLALDAFTATEGVYTPALCVDQNDIAAMAKNCFANDILCKVDGTAGLVYTPQQTAAFRTMADIWGDYFRDGGMPTRDADDPLVALVLAAERDALLRQNKGDMTMTPAAHDRFVRTIEQGLREMGQARVHNDYHADNVLVHAAAMADVDISVSAYPIKSSVSIKNIYNPTVVTYDINGVTGERPVIVPPPPAPAAPDQLGPGLA